MDTQGNGTQTETRLPAKRRATGSKINNGLLAALDAMEETAEEAVKHTAVMLPNGKMDKKGQPKVSAVVVKGSEALATDDTGERSDNLDALAREDIWPMAVTQVERVTAQGLTVRTPKVIPTGPLVRAACGIENATTLTEREKALKAEALKTGKV